MRRTNWNLYNLPEEYQVKLCEDYKNYAKYDSFWYINYDCVYFYKNFILDENTILDPDGPPLEWFLDKEPTVDSTTLNFEEVYNLLKPYLRKEKLNKILNK